MNNKQKNVFDYYCMSFFVHTRLFMCKCCVQWSSLPQLGPIWKLNLKCYVYILYIFCFHFWGILSLPFRSFLSNQSWWYGGFRYKQENTMLFNYEACLFVYLLLSAPKCNYIKICYKKDIVNQLHFHDWCSTLDQYVSHQSSYMTREGSSASVQMESSLLHSSFGRASKDYDWQSDCMYIKNNWSDGLSNVWTVSEQRTGLKYRLQKLASFYIIGSTMDGQVYARRSSLFEELSSCAHVALGCKRWDIGHFERWNIFARNC